MSSSAPRRQAVPEAQPFSYLDAGVAAGAVPTASSAGRAGAGESPAGSSNPGPSAEERNQQLQAAAFERGRQTAEQKLRAELEGAAAKNREAVARALREFAAERTGYYRRVEGEVVALALAIARKVLHREAQIDPQTLAGIVRVTLEKLENGTKVDLRVHPREATEWRHYFACQMGDAPAPEVHEDAALAPGECRIETSMGSPEVGLETQLKEIETGLLDLLAERPGAESGRVPQAAPQV